MMIPHSTPAAGPSWFHNRAIVLLYGSIRSLLENKPSYDPLAVDAAIGKLIEVSLRANEQSTSGGEAAARIDSQSVTLGKTSCCQRVRLGQTSMSIGAAFQPER